MGVVSKIINFFRKKQEDTGHYCTIEWSKNSKEFALGYNYLKKIYHFYNGELFEKENFNEIKLRQLNQKKIPIIDLTRGESVPKDSIFVPRTMKIMDELQITKRI